MKSIFFNNDLKLYNYAYQCTTAVIYYLLHCFSLSFAVISKLVYLAVDSVLNQLAMTCRIYWFPKCLWFLRAFSLI